MRGKKRECNRRYSQSHFNESSLVEAYICVCVGVCVCVVGGVCGGGLPLGSKVSQSVAFLDLVKQAMKIVC